MTASPSNVRLQRAYDDPTPDDGHFVLVDRLWPHGRTKEQLRFDAWARDLGPSTQLRKWFAHDPARWPEFQARYHAEHAEPDRARRSTPWPSGRVEARPADAEPSTHAYRRI